RARARDGGTLRAGAAMLEGVGVAPQKGALESDGSFEVAGLHPGASYRISFFTARGNDAPWWWMSTGGNLVAVPQREEPPELELEVVPATLVSISVDCTELPETPGFNERVDSAAQIDLGRRSSLVATDGSGRVIARVDRVGRRSNALVVPVGDWTITL